MKTTRHILNGKLLGVYYETDNHKIYLGHRQLRHLNRKFTGWTIDAATLHRCRDRGFHHVGIVCRRGGVKHVWLSTLDDWFDPGRSFGTRSKKYGVERGLRLKRFRVDPASCAKRIDAAFRIG